MVSAKIQRLSSSNGKAILNWPFFIQQRPICSNTTISEKSITQLIKIQNVSSTPKINNFLILMFIDKKDHC
jgi:hypothetical protein